MKDKILITGANGQLGSVLTTKLQGIYGTDAVIATDIKFSASFKGNFEFLDATDFNSIEGIIKEHNITQIYHMAAILSANGEQQPLRTWDINNKTFLNVLEAARLNGVDRVFFPSSIAVYGENAPKDETPQDFFLVPTTVYGMSKASGEHWANYYFSRYGLDVRSLRYPGVIGHQTSPGGGTTDYAVDAYHYAVKGEDYTCFLNETASLPMIYMDDAIRATIELMEAQPETIKTRTSYNIASMSFNPAELQQAICEIFPNFKMIYKPDFRQNIADSWPNSIDDSEARKDWGWQPNYDLKAMTKDMIKHLNKKYKTENA
ncbi:NAD-dependent epimerase/dehydratase family protein [Hyunsoonleella flava]|uniref:NAD-dependent epimerase/dehydratase family protein n=1 Tax=Hyunsoonleella flava TaxID=2527939 RepID=A0A4Q9FI24_9FLAO|nr:NAD-dependent epimerase/dehydratase family protein [Hyunsoonleella flava]TBN06758.1 NAD-dependent epimerase/dehydratase family protein [Hyunsoonleella flava]